MLSGLSNWGLDRNECDDASNSELGLMSSYTRENIWRCHLRLQRNECETIFFTGYLLNAPLLLLNMKLIME
jgi:hypothetical protein